MYGGIKVCACVQMHVFTIQRTTSSIGFLNAFHFYLVSLFVLFGFVFYLFEERVSLLAQNLKLG